MEIDETRQQAEGFARLAKSQADFVALEREIGSAKGRHWALEDASYAVLKELAAVDYDDCGPGTPAVMFYSNAVGGLSEVFDDGDTDDYVLAFVEAAMAVLAGYEEARDRGELGEVK
jgi:hypothetical protein